MPPKSFTRVSPVEHDAMRRMHASGSGVKSIAKAMNRSTDTVSKHVFKKNTAKKATGRPKHSIRTTKGFLAAERAYKKLLKASGGQKEVTADALKAEMKLACDVKTVRRAFAENGYMFRPLSKRRWQPQLSSSIASWAPCASAASCARMPRAATSLRAAGTERARAIPWVPRRGRSRAGAAGGPQQARASVDPRERPRRCSRRAGAAGGL